MPGLVAAAEQLKNAHASRSVEVVDRPPEEEYVQDVGAFYALIDEVLQPLLPPAEEIARWGTHRSRIMDCRWQIALFSGAITAEHFKYAVLASTVAGQGGHVHTLNMQQGNGKWRMVAYEYERKRLHGEDCIVLAAKYVDAAGKTDMTYNAQGIPTDNTVALDPALAALIAAGQAQAAAAQAQVAVALDKIGDALKPGAPPEAPSAPPLRTPKG